MATNPINRPMTALFERSLAAADHLRVKNDGGKYKAAIGMAKMLAGQIDDVVASNDAEAINRMNMRIIPNYHKCLFGLGLTPEGYARITGVTASAPGAATGGPEDDDTNLDTPEVEEQGDQGDALDSIISETDAKVLQLKGRR